MTNLLKVLSLFLFLIVLSCAEKKSSTATFDVKKADYIENIKAVGAIEAVNSQSFKAPKIYYPMLVARLVDDGSFVSLGDTICVIDCPELYDRLESSETRLEVEKASAKKLDADNLLDLAMLEAQIANNKTQMKIIALDSLQKKFAPEAKRRIIELEYQKAELEQKNLARKFQSRKKINEAELRKSKSRIKQQENRISSSVDQIKQLNILATTNGLVLHVESPIMRYYSSNGAGQIGGKIKEGSSIWQDMSLLEMPDLSEMQVKIEVPESDFKRIEVGQKVLIAVDASNRLQTTGKVKKKPVVGKTNDYESKVKSFEIIISVDSCHALMKPGLSANCEIIIKEIKDQIVVPSISVFEEDSAKVVYIKTDKKFVLQKVDIGYVTNTISIISKGLKGEETIALMRPGANEIKKQSKTELKVDTLKHQPDTTIISNIQNKTDNEKPDKK